MVYLMLFVPLVLFLLINLFAVNVTRKSFGICIGPTMLSSALLLFWGQLLTGTFFYSSFVIAALAIAGPVSLLFVKDKKSVSSLYLTKGMFVFIAIVIVELIVNAGAHVQEWDEYAHWAPMTAEMLRYDRFYNVSWSKVFEHKEYPPFAALFEYIWIKLSGKHTDSGLYSALRVLEYSLVIPFITDKKGSKVNNVISSFILFLIMVVCLASYGEDGLVNQIRPDLLMAIMFGLSLYFIFRYDVFSEKFAWLYLTIMMMSLAIVKQVAIVFVIICLMLVLVSYLTSFKERKHATDYLKLVAIIISPFFMRALWSYSCHIEGTSGGQFAYGEKGLGNMLLEIFAIMSGEVEGDRAETFFTFVREVFSRQLGLGIIKMSFVTSITFAVISLIILCFISKKSSYEGVDTAKYKGLIIISVLGSILYTGVILITNLFFFSEDEMTSLACFERYMSTYIIAMIIVVGMIMWDIVTQRIDKVANPGIMGLILLCSIVMYGATGLYNFMPRAFKEDDTRMIRQYAEYLKASTEEGAKIFVADDGIEGPVYLIYLMGSRDFVADREYGAILDIDPDDAEEVNKYINKLAECSYLFIYKKSDSMDAAFSLLNNNEPFEEGALYSIIKDGGSIKFDMVN